MAVRRRRLVPSSSACNGWLPPDRVILGLNGPVDAGGGPGSTSVSAIRRCRPEDRDQAREDMTKKLTAVLAAMGTLAVLGLGPAEPVASARPSAAATPTGVLMIGDSTTKRVTPWLAEHHPGWHVDGQGGRPSEPSGTASMSTCAATLRRPTSSWRWARTGRPTPTGTKEAPGPGDQQAACRDERLPDDGGARRAVPGLEGLGAARLQPDLPLSGEARPNTWIIDWRGTVLLDSTLNRGPAGHCCWKTAPTRPASPTVRPGRAWRPTCG